jgi:hypothetical protein
MLGFHNIRRVSLLRSCQVDSRRRPVVEALVPARRAAIVNPVEALRAE